MLGTHSARLAHVAEMDRLALFRAAWPMGHRRVVGLFLVVGVPGHTASVVARHVGLRLHRRRVHARHGTILMAKGCGVIGAVHSHPRVVHHGGILHRRKTGSSVGVHVITASAASAASVVAVLRLLVVVSCRRGTVLGAWVHGVLGRGLVVVAVVVHFVEVVVFDGFMLALAAWLSLGGVVMAAL